MHDIMTPNVRRVAYIIYAVVGMVLGATQVGFSAAEMGQPVALTVALAVFAFIGTGFGLVAQGNITEDYDG